MDVVDLGFSGTFAETTTSFSPLISRRVWQCGHVTVKLAMLAPSTWIVR